MIEDDTICEYWELYEGENNNNFYSIMSFISSFTTNIASKRSCSCLRFDGTENAAIIEHLRAHVFAFFFKYLSEACEREGKGTI